MKRTLCLAVAVSLVYSASTAAQGDVDENLRSLLNAVVSEARIQATSRALDSSRGRRPPPGWQVVRLIDPGVEISILLAGSGSRLGQFVSATDEELIVRDSALGA
jgi:hypothetical protein